MHTITKKNCCKLNYNGLKNKYQGFKKGACYIGCKYFKTGDCEGSRGIIALPNGQSVNMPLYHEYKDNYYKDIEMEIKKKDCITKMELLEILKEKYNLEFSKRSLQFYITEKLIEPGIIEYFPGISGAVSFYNKKIPGMIYAIQELVNKYDISLKDIKNYKDIIYEFNVEALACYLPNYKNIEDEIEISKFRTALTYFACAEASLKGNNKMYTIIDKRIGEIHVIIKDLSMPEIWDSAEHVKNSFAADLIRLKNPDMVNLSQDDLNILLNNLKTIKTIIFKPGVIEVL